MSFFTMPRKARIDAPGAVHHIIFRGIERRRIFNDKIDYGNFIDRLGKVLTETSTPCYSWALMPNHAHLLIRTGRTPIATVIRRLLTGYAQQFNRRHRRHGHLFQNRYKSILCEEELYLLELVRYIHLNRLRAGIVKDLKGLDRDPYCGHSALLGRRKIPWQDTVYVLRRFGRGKNAARRDYRDFIAKGVKQGKRSDLIGGGLVRSVGGWSALKAIRNTRVRVMGDERILGSSEFVAAVLKQANEDYEEKIRQQSDGMSLSALLRKVADHFGLSPELLMGSSKQSVIVEARSFFCYLATARLMESGTEVARMLKISPSTVSKAAYRGGRDQSLIKLGEELLTRK